MPPSLRWDIVCRVVDNFGDAGVCFRLARQLAAEHGMAVTLWIDDVASLARIVAGLAATDLDILVEGVRVRTLASHAPERMPLPDVVVEGFGCGLPDGYVAAMAGARKPPVWIVLEYLSAEAWIDASHALPSRHPHLPLTRWFWFPGFTAKTGGLLRERGLVAAREAFRADPRGRAAAWQAHGLVLAPGALAISLFCYANPALPALLDAWADGDDPIACIVPEGVALRELDAWTGGALPHAGSPLQRGRLTLAVAPFVDQDAFDRRLWACDLAFVRGEDSFVRAQWATVPFVWHVYPQETDAHLAKMDAFLLRFEAHATPAGRATQRAFWYAWNADDGVAVAAAWPAYRAALPALQAAARTWAADQATHPNLAAKLVNFCESKL